MKKFYVIVCLILAVSCAYLGKSREEWIKNAQNETLPTSKQTVKSLAELLLQMQQNT